MNFFICTDKRWIKCLVLESWTGTSIVFSVNLSTWVTPLMLMIWILLPERRVLRAASNSNLTDGYWRWSLSSWVLKRPAAVVNCALKLFNCSYNLALLILCCIVYLKDDPSRPRRAPSKALSNSTWVRLVLDNNTSNYLKRAIIWVLVLLETLSAPPLPLAPSLIKASALISYSDGQVTPSKRSLSASLGNLALLFSKFLLILSKDYLSWFE
jgi:hypothetical protein